MIWTLAIRSASRQQYKRNEPDGCNSSHHTSVLPVASAGRLSPRPCVEASTPHATLPSKIAHYTDLVEERSVSVAARQTEPRLPAFDHPKLPEFSLGVTWTLRRSGAPILPFIQGHGGSLPWLGTLPGVPPAWRKLLIQRVQIFRSSGDSVPTALPVGS